MLIAVIILSIICAVLLAVLIIRYRAAIKAAEKLREIRKEDTNQLLHTSGRALPPELINEVNSILKDIRRYDAEYQRKNHDLEQMMTNISHDLRTPLTSAMGHISMAQDDNISSEERSHSIVTAEKMKSSRFIPTIPEKRPDHSKN